MMCHHRMASLVSLIHDESPSRCPLAGPCTASVERFYDAPLVANLTCDGATLSFTAWNAFKQQGALHYIA